MSRRWHRLPGCLIASYIRSKPHLDAAIGQSDDLFRRWRWIQYGLGWVLRQSFPEYLLCAHRSMTGEK